MFSSILELIQKIQEGKLRKQQKETKKIVREKEDKLNKENDNNIVQSKDAAQKSPEAQQSKQEEKKLKFKVRLIRVLKLILEFLESFVTFMISLFGVFGFFIVLAVLVLMFILFGFLSLDMEAFTSSIFQGSSEDCVQGSEVMTSNEFDLSQISQLMGTFKPEEKKAAQMLTVYSEILNRDLTTVLENPTYLNEIKDTLTVSETIFFLYGFGAVENTGGLLNIPTSEDDLLKYPSLQDDGNYVFLGLHRDNIFDGKYQYNGRNNGDGVKYLTDSFYQDIKAKYVPAETPIYENNFMPYGVSTQIGVYGGSSLGSTWGIVDSKIDAVMSEYGISANADILKAYLKLFAGSAAYHSGATSTLNTYNDTNLISLWCALWSATSDIDTDRGFGKVKVVSSSYNYTESQMRDYIYGSVNLKMTWDEALTGFFEINGEKIDTVLWDWVSKNCSNPEYFNSTAKVWLNTFSGYDFILDSSYGFSAYIIGRDLAMKLGASAPLTSSGSVDDCECYETNNPLNLNERDFSNVVIGEPQGIYPADKLEIIKGLKKYQPYYGRLDSIQYPNEKVNDRVEYATDMTREEWRLNSKWKVPYQYQNRYDAWQVSSLFRALHYKGNACPMYAQSYVYSAMTGRAVNIQEIMAAEWAYYNDGAGSTDNTGSYYVRRAQFAEMAGDAGFYVRYFTWDKSKGIGVDKDVTQITKGAENYKSILYPTGTIKEQIDHVLENNGIVIVHVKGSVNGTLYTSATSQHHFPIIEKVGENSYMTHAASRYYLDVTPKTLEQIIGPNGAFLSSNDGNLMFAYNPSLSSGGSSVSTNSTNVSSSSGVKEVVIPDSVKQSGLIADYTNYVIWVDKWGVADGTNQEVVSELWKAKGRAYDTEKDIATLDGYYLVACTDKYGFSGDAITVVLEDDTQINCIIGDTKRYTDAQSTEWGHMKPTGISLIEWEAYGTTEGASAGVDVKLGEWYGKKVKKIINHGSYLENNNVFSYFGKNSTTECISSSSNSSTMASGTANAKETKEERWQRLLDDSVSSYYNSAWDEGLSRRGASATWHKYVEYVEKNQLEVITVKAWDLKNRGMLTATKEGISEESAWESYEFDLLVHKGVASAVKAAFDEIYALPINERLPIKKSISSKTEKGFTYNFNGACFAFGARGNGSIHCIGVAIDINPDANPMKSSSTNKGYGNMKNYKPGVNPYSISSTSKVVEILGKYGFEWGDGYSDYMHFSYLENVNDNIEDYSSLVK